MVKILSDLPVHTEEIGGTDPDAARSPRLEERPDQLDAGSQDRGHRRALYPESRDTESAEDKDHVKAHVQHHGGGAYESALGGPPAGLHDAQIDLGDPQGDIGKACDLKIGRAPQDQGRLIGEQPHDPLREDDRPRQEHGRHGRHISHGQPQDPFHRIPVPFSPILGRQHRRPLHQDRDAQVQDKGHLSRQGDR